MGDGLGSNRALLILFRGRPLRGRRRHIRCCALQVVLEFRNVEHANQLAGFHAIANIHLHVADITCFFGHDVDFIERFQLRRQRDFIVKIHA